MQTAADTGVELAFRVEGAAPLDYAASPTLAFRLAVESRGEVPIRSLLLDVQLQIAARLRSYQAAEQERLGDMFGAPERWRETLRTLPWTRATLLLPPFSGSTVAELPVPCTYDLEVTAAAYLGALEGGEVPLEFLFSGTVFYATPGGLLQATRIPWTAEAGYSLPVSVWRETMDRHFPDSAWLRLSRRCYDRLRAHRARNAFASWDELIESLLGREDDARLG